MNKYFLLVAILLTGCSVKSEIRPPETESEILNNFIRSVTVQYIDLDKVRSKEIKLVSSNIIYDVNQNERNDSLVIGNIKYFTSYNDNYYFIFDSFQNSIFKLDSNGSFKGVLGRVGKGPGEYQLATSLKSNSQSVFVADPNNARINVYEPGIKTSRALEPFISSLSSLRIDVNNTKILLGNANSAGFQPESENQGLILIADIKNLTDTLGTIMPRIIPPGYQPAVFNQVNFSMSDNSFIAASYEPLPWIFVFNEKYKLERALIFRSHVFDDMDLPALKLFKPKGNQGYGGAIPIRAYRILNNKDIVMAIRDELIHVTHDTDGNYKLKNKYKFIYLDESKPLYIYELSDTGDNRIVATNGELLFEFQL